MSSDPVKDMISQFNLTIVKKYIHAADIECEAFAETYPEEKDNWELRSKFDMCTLGFTPANKNYYRQELEYFSEIVHNWVTYTACDENISHKVRRHKLSFLMSAARSLAVAQHAAQYMDWDTIMAKKLAKKTSS